MTTTTQQATQETLATSARDLTKTYGRGELLSGEAGLTFATHRRRRA
jgi:hypothetical protein